MRILHINERGIWPFGGGEKYLSGICNDLEKLGHEIAIMSSSTWLRNNLEVLAQTSQTPCSMLDTRRRQGSEGRKSSIQHPVSSMRREYLAEACPGFRSGLRAIDKVKEIIQRENPDVVNLHGALHLSPLIVHVIHRMRPTVQFVHYVAPFCLNGQKILAYQNQICDLPVGPHCFRRRCYLFDPESGYIHNIKGIAVKFCQLEIAKRLDKIIVGSKYMRDQLLKNGFSEKRIAVIPCYTDKISATLGFGPRVCGGYEDSDLRESKTRPKPFTDENMILFVGRLHRIKGIYQFIQSLGLIRDKKWQANIVGDGKEMDGAIHLAKRLGLDDRVHFVGKMPFEMVDSYYEHCTLVVMPSMIPESFGLVGIEAMAFGKPVVAFNVGGVTEWLVHNETGFLVERGNIQGLANRIAELLDDNALAAKLGSAGKRQVEKRFRKDRHINGLTKVYEEVIEKRKRNGLSSAALASGEREL